MVSTIFLNQTGVVADIVYGMIELTGDWFTSMMLIVILLVVLCLALKMPLEMTAIFVLPFLIVCYAFVPSFSAVTGVTLIYLGVILAKNIFLK